MGVILFMRPVSTSKEIFFFMQIISMKKTHRLCRGEQAAEKTDQEGAGRQCDEDVQKIMSQQGSSSSKRWNVLMMSDSETSRLEW